ncbi:MAG: TldD/PmbA family protein [Oscillospiraceae bacterium]|jgi:PmbA protein|nr:TldD/PmbA family protein [Oscillospiraceae bacterium]
MSTQNKTAFKNDALDIFIGKLLAAAKAGGVDKAEAYLRKTESFQSFVENGEVSEYGVNSSGGLALRALVGGKMGTAYTEAFDDDAIDMLVSRVLESASLIEDPDEQFLFGGSASYTELDTLARTPGGGTADEKIKYACDLEKLTLSLDPLVTKLGYQNGVESTHTQVRIVGTNGLNLRHEADGIAAIVMPVAKRGERTSDSTGLRLARNLSDLPMEEMAKEAVAEAVFMLDAAPCESGSYEVILRFDAMSMMLTTFQGVFSAENTQKGLSLLKGKVGEAIAAPCVTLKDDPHREGGGGSRPFDDEGVATFPKNVIDGGKLTTLLHNLKTAKKDGVAATGNAAKGSYAATVKVAPSNFHFQPGGDGLDALCESMGEGLVITDLAGTHAGANDISGEFSLLSKGYRVRGGKKAEPVEQITVAGNFFDMLKHIKAVGSDLRFPFGGAGSPSVWVGTLSVAGK